MSITKKRALEIAQGFIDLPHHATTEEMMRYGRELKAYLNREPKRKIVQIVSSNGRLFALCNDGTLWKHNTIPGESRAWWELDTFIPQPE